MMYETLSEETRTKLEETGKYLVHMTDDMEKKEVWDAIRLLKDSPVDETQFSAYEATDAKTWFEFSTKSMSDEEAGRFAENALIV